MFYRQCAGSPVRPRRWQIEFLLRWNWKQESLLEKPSYNKLEQDILVVKQENIYCKHFIYKGTNADSSTGIKPLFMLGTLYSTPFYLTFPLNRDFM